MNKSEVLFQLRNHVNYINVDDLSLLINLHEYINDMSHYCDDSLDIFFINKGAFYINRCYKHGFIYSWNSSKDCYVSKEKFYEEIMSYEK